MEKDFILMKMPKAIFNWIINYVAGAKMSQLDASALPTVRPLKAAATKKKDLYAEKIQAEFLLFLQR